MYLPLSIFHGVNCVTICSVFFNPSIINWLANTSHTGNWLFTSVYGDKTSNYLMRGHNPTIVMDVAPATFTHMPPANMFTKWTGYEEVSVCDVIIHHAAFVNGGVNQTAAELMAYTSNHSRMKQRMWLHIHAHIPFEPCFVKGSWRHESIYIMTEFSYLSSMAKSWPASTYLTCFIFFLNVHFGC